MRKVLIPLLLATALTPVAASARDTDSPREDRARAERSERSSDRASRSQARSERQAVERAERAERAQQVERPGKVERADRGSAERPQRVEPAKRGERQARPGRVNRDTPVAQQVQAPQPVESEQQVQHDRGSDNPAGGFAQLGRDIADGRVNDRDRHHDRDWSRDWRKDRRYDWSNYRNRYGSLYRLGRYHDPYGWGYRRFSIGFNIWPSYYGSNYWLGDPWMYRLPPAYGPYRWVRYYDDAILVNVYTGFVVDVIHNFFW